MCHTPPHIIPLKFTSTEVSGTLHLHPVLFQQLCRVLLNIDKTAAENLFFSAIPRTVRSSRIRLEIMEDLSPILLEIPWTPPSRSYKAPSSGHLSNNYADIPALPLNQTSSGQVTTPLAQRPWQWQTKKKEKYFQGHFDPAQ
ncbi:hypothetical protein ElyMa_002277800 [Elysia marginata]|uniref:Uncharacterized protein n=1 Tax=Elysia marginata TaxID=1093978 RepID=A0AAV4G0F6_9GAST|nr:hypothetical protein ElyMa_002277800 [Elysia marginata]